jgi:hypothetical protein
MKCWRFDFQPNYGPGYVQLALGVRFTISEAALALFVDLLLFEVMVQFDLPEPKEGR